MNESPTQRLARLDHDHLWHPFTAMRQWREQPPVIIERGEGFEIVDTDGHRYIDGVSSLWCNVHGHQVPEIDQAVRDQLGRIAHTTLLGLSSPPAIEFAAKLAEITPGGLSKTFYSDAGATAVEVAFKMAVGYWHHQGQPQKHKFIGLAEAYHGDTTGAMSVGYSELFHKPFLPMVFPVSSFPHPDPVRPPREVRRRVEKLPHAHPRDPSEADVWPSEDPRLREALLEYCLDELEKMLQEQGHETAAIVIEPVMQGAAGMICQPPGFVGGVADLARKYDVLLIADEVATGFARTGRMFAVEHDGVEPDIMCLAKGISGGYLPLAATVVTDAIDEAFTGSPEEKKTLYHGHTYTGNPLACAAALASLELIEKNDVVGHSQQSSELIREKLLPLHESPHVLDVRQRGLMVGIELGRSREHAEAFDFSKRTAAKVCEAMRPHGLMIRPLGDVMVLMPAPAMDHDTLARMLDIVVDTVLAWPVKI
ncbi:MAG: adenosylmethionine--8-amino-7-oxononanoate transaminase [Phycisphaeraceae bacterium]